VKKQEQVNALEKRSEIRKSEEGSNFQRAQILKNSDSGRNSERRGPRERNEGNWVKRYRAVLPRGKENDGLINLREAAKGLLRQEKGGKRRNGGKSYSFT